MSASVISPDFKIKIFQPNTDSPLDFPMKYISSITSVRGLRGNSMTINFSKDNKPFGLPYRAYFQDQSIVQLLVRRSPNEAYRQENLCYVSAVSSQGTPNKRSESITISGFETKLRNQNLFLDIVNAEEPEVLDSTWKAINGNDAFVKSITKFSKSVFTNLRSLRILFLAVYDNLIARLSNPHIDMAFGNKGLFGKSISDPKNLKDFIIVPFAMKDGYTTNFIHTLNLMNGYTIGANVNFWDVITSLECEPLYELFFDALETLPNENPILNYDSTQSEDYDLYSVNQEQIAFVFRKTPFDFEMDYNSAEYKRYTASKSLPSSKIKSLTCSFSQDNVYTGVHVGMSFLGQVSSTLIQHPSWHPILLNHFGYKPLRVMLDGVTFPETATLKEIQNSFGLTLKKIQDRLYKIFCSFPAFKAGIVDIETQYDFFRPGTTLEFDNPETDFGDVGYIESVTSSFQAKGQATSQISLKWVNYELKTNTSKQIVPPSNWADSSLNQTNTATDQTA